MDNIKLKLGIYLLRNKINGKIYIGKSVNLRQRMYGHKCDANRKRIYTNSPITLAIAKYSWENFEVEILESWDQIDHNILLTKEAEWIAKLDSTNKKIGYNVLAHSIGWSGKTPGSLYSGDKNPMFGRKHTEETKKRFSEIRLKNGLSKGIKNSMFGKKHRPDSLIKLKEASLKGCAKTMKRVNQIDPITNNIIKTWNSVSEAGHGFGGNVSSAISLICTGRKKGLVKGFIWKFA